MMKPGARAQMTLPPTPTTLLNVWGPIQIVWGSYILYGAAHTCMVRAALYCLYCAHLAIFMQYTGVFPTVAPRVNLTAS